MSIKHLYEDERPSLLLDFANSKTLDPRITFERQSVGTYVDEAGIIKTAADNEARFDHNPETGECLGLLIEESRTNLIPESTNLNNTTHWHTSTNPGSLNQSANAGWMVATANTTEVVSPDGTNNACKLSGLTTTTFDKNYKVHVVPNSGSVSLSANVVYTFTLFVKDPDSVINGDNLLVFMYGSKFSNTNAQVRFNLSNDTFDFHGDINNESASITPYPNGWKKLTATFTNTNSGGGPRYFLQEISPKTGTVNGYSATQFSLNGEKFYVWGFQTEEGSFGSSYMPTAGSTYQRLADEAEIGGNNFSDFFNFGPHTTVVEWDRSSDITTRGYLYRYMQNTNIAAEFLEQLSIDSFIDANLWWGQKDFSNIPYTKSKAALAVIDGNAFFAVGGTLISPTGNRAPSSGSTTRMVIGYNSSGEYLNGHIKRIDFYNTRLSDTALKALTL